MALLDTCQPLGMFACKNAALKFFHVAKLEGEEVDLIVDMLCNELSDLDVQFLVANLQNHARKLEARRAFIHDNIPF